MLMTMNLAQNNVFPFTVCYLYLSREWWYSALLQGGASNAYYKEQKNTKRNCRIPGSDLSDTAVLFLMEVRHEHT